MSAPAVPARPRAVGVASAALSQGARLVGWLGPLVIAALCWEGISRSGLVSARVLPPFSDVLAETAAMLAEGDVLSHLGASLYRALFGLVLGAALGSLLGVTMAIAPLARRTLYPLLTLTYTLPKSALIPIALLWLGVGNASTILVVFTATLVPMIINAYHGAEAVPERFIWSARSMGTSRARLVTAVVVPSAMPNIMSGLRIALALSMVVTISAEMVASFTGIGKFIFNFGEAGSYTHMFAAIIIAVSAVFVIDRAFGRVSRFLLRWTEGGHLGV